MVNYEHGKIYKIVCNETGLIYIGSTAQKYLSTRLGGHKANYKQYLNGNFNYITSFKIIEGNNFDILLIEKYSCKDNYELKAKERYYSETMDCVNKTIPNRTPKEHYIDNKKTLNKNSRTHYKDNKEKRKKQIKHYRKTNKENIQEHNRQYY